MALGERKLSEEPQELLGFSSGKTDIASTTGERDVKSSETSIIYGKTEDTSDMKLDFPFETELSQLTDDKATKGMRDLARSIQQSTMSPSTADLNFKIASVKKVSARNFASATKKKKLDYRNFFKGLGIYAHRHGAF